MCAHRFERQAVAETTKESFFAMAGFPNVLGGGGGEGAWIARMCELGPTVNKHEYVNRKGYHSLNVQLICNAKLRIMNADVKWPGKCSPYTINYTPI